MVRGPKPTDQAPTPPQDFAQVPPRDLYPTSDIRFVMHEVGKLTANVERLISDVQDQGGKLDAIRHQVSFIKGALAASGVLISVLVVVVGFFLSSKWDSILAAVKTVQTLVQKSP